jgi:hypothetical protein
MAIAESKLSISENRLGKNVEVDIFHIDQIPNAMDKMGWDVSAQLMRHWFSICPEFKFTQKNKNSLLNNDARLIPHQQVNQSIVKMSWARKHISSQIDNLHRNWNSKNGVDLLNARLKCAGYNRQNCVQIGNSNNPQVLDATAQVNIEIVGGLLDTLNDWYGAIGNASLKVAVKGHTSIIKNRKVFITEALGYYLKDTYDFYDEKIIGSEPLGIWSKNRVLTKAESIAYMDSYSLFIYGYLARRWSGFVPIFNADFREWQDKHKCGGDFIVFSDVLWLEPLEGQRIIYL